MAPARFRSISLVLHVLVTLFFALAEAANSAKAEEKASYAPGDAIPVSCLNRTV